MYKVKTLNKISPRGLCRLDGEKYVCGDDFDTPEAVIVRSASMHETELPDTLLCVARAGAGYNNIPVDKCTAKGICVFNTPGANANAVKELTVCGLLLASRRVAQGIKWTDGLAEDEGISKTVEKGKSAFVGPELAGKTLGVVGLGAIGRLVANQAVLLGMDVIGYDPFLSDKMTALLADGIKTTKSLDDVYVAADYITLHAPSTADTKNMINSASIAKCKDGVRIVNFARGDLVNSADLIEAVKSGKVAAYVTDFPSNTMIGVENITAIPHLGASTPESEENCAIMAAEQTAAYLERGDVANSVNLPALTREYKGGRRVSVIYAGGADELSSLLANAGVKAEEMSVAERGGTAYALADTGIDLGSLREAEGVLRVRTIG